jgi:hypothetical protein
LVEQWFVEPVVKGSIPFSRQIFITLWFYLLDDMKLINLNKFWKLSKKNNYNKYNLFVKSQELKNLFNQVDLSLLSKDQRTAIIANYRTTKRLAKFVIFANYKMILRVFGVPSSVSKYWLIRFISNTLYSTAYTYLVLYGKRFVSKTAPFLVECINIRFAFLPKKIPQSFSTDSDFTKIIYPRNEYLNILGNWFDFCAKNKIKSEKILRMDSSAKKALILINEFCKDFAELKFYKVTYQDYIKRFSEVLFEYQKIFQLEFSNFLKKQYFSTFLTKTAESFNWMLRRIYLKKLVIGRTERKLIRDHQNHNDSMVNAEIERQKSMFEAVDKMFADKLSAKERLENATRRYLHKTDQAKINDQEKQLKILEMKTNVKTATKLELDKFIVACKQELVELKMKLSRTIMEYKNSYSPYALEDKKREVMEALEKEKNAIKSRQTQLLLEVKEARQKAKEENAKLAAAVKEARQKAKEEKTKQITEARETRNKFYSEEAALNESVYLDNKKTEKEVREHNRKYSRTKK